MAENHLRSALSENRFFFSAELVLGRDQSVPDAESFVKDAAADPDGIKIMSITDLPGGNPALPPESFVSFILDNGLTPLAHLSGKDGNRAFIESRLHGLARAGAESILALTGDAPKDGFRGRPRPVYDLDSVFILMLVKAMREGLAYQLGSRTIKSTPFDFLPGAVVSPFKTSEAGQMMQLYKLELKLAAGARFIITQLGYNLRKLYELKQYLNRTGLGHVPVVANVYVPTATVAKMMRDGEVAGCVIPEELIRRLEKDKKPERIERAALMVAAARDLGFAGAHVGGFRLSHADVTSIRARSLEIGSAWRGRLDELVFPVPGEFYLFPAGADGLSDGNGPMQLSTSKPSRPGAQWVSEAFHTHVISDRSWAGRFLRARLGDGPKTADDPSWRHGAWYGLIGMSSTYRKATMDCQSCGDCVQDHLSYAGCTMRWCYKQLRNGPCGGSRIDDACEFRPEQPCWWTEVYDATLASGKDPRRFATTVIPPRDWRLDLTNALANHFAELDNYPRRESVEASKG
jgi:methylenetetrahydrofolate reductase (NADPH)